MSRPDDDRTVEQPVVETPSVSTAPPPSPEHRWWSAIPSHLGRARTSTVVLALLFLSIGTLYLNVRPDPVPPATTPGTVQTTTPADTTEPPTTTAPETAAPEPTEEAPATTDPEPTSDPTEGTTEPAPEPTTGDLPTVGPDPEPEPTTAGPTG